ncbi:hypothetical protein [Falsiroseomonas tokyonensis]|uniref:Uncharacterized protein n=1 Tax=Falsiroseomonas tokyonensis TaxID=430521 RepID=A0ABV7BUH3_9PROT|nr:hypothetical protein [Falsiroseomonas tokyonensis]MBU8537637.1 hypothetical protein [Falsiroseomonas tokyonensis]
MDRRLVGQRIVHRTPRPAPSQDITLALPQGAIVMPPCGGRVVGEGVARHSVARHAMRQGAARHAMRQSAAARAPFTGTGARRTAAGRGTARYGIRADLGTAGSNLTLWGAARREPGSPASTSGTPITGTKRRS